MINDYSSDTEVILIHVELHLLVVDREECEERRRQRCTIHAMAAVRT